MMGKLARRLGFQQSVPVALVDNWLIPTPQKPLVVLAPREGAASCSVDEVGRIQVEGASWTLDLTLAAGARWVAAAETERVAQKLLAPGVLETTYQTPSGSIVQRIAAGVVDGEPVAIVEIENTGGVAIAAGVVARPIQLDGRGFIGEIAVAADGIAVDGARAIRFSSVPAAVNATDGAAGDLLQSPPDADAATGEASAKCRSGGAQAVAVWPLPHTATLRFTVELGRSTSPQAAVPTTDDVNRGWQAHLKQGLRVDVDGTEIDEHLGDATRTVLTLWPTTPDTPLALHALSEAGFGRDGGRFFDLLERCDDDGQVLRSLARWAQLGEQAHQLEDLERILGRLAQAAHGIANQGSSLPGPAWLEAALITLGGRLHQIGQPDVADRVQGFNVTGKDGNVAASPGADQLASLTKARDKRGVWADGNMASAARYVRVVRSLVAADTGHELQVLPSVPTTWRGRTVDVFDLPVADGSVSFGIRWHGPRPALLWEANLAPEAPFQISAPGIDASFSSQERSGETLLADPEWQPS